MHIFSHILFIEIVLLGADQYSLESAASTLL